MSPDLFTKLSPHSMSKEQLENLSAMLSRQHSQLLATTTHERAALIGEQFGETYTWLLGEKVASLREALAETNEPSEATQASRHLETAEDMCRQASRCVCDLFKLRDELGEGWELLNHVVGAVGILRRTQHHERDEKGRFLSLNDRLEGIAARLERVRQDLAMVGALPPSSDAAAEVAPVEPPSAELQEAGDETTPAAA